MSAKFESELRAYSGERCSEHLGVPGSRRKTYASDISGTKIYEFNSSGFRGEALNPNAAFRLYLCGPSYGFGTGLNWEETWGFQLKCLIGDHLGLDRESVNLLNFSQSLASANYITRTLLGQCEAVRPEFVIGLYSFCSRSEIYLDGCVTGITPTRYSWHRRLRTLRPGWYKRLARQYPDLASRQDASRRLDAMNHYHGIYSDELGVANTLTQILLLQSYCRLNGIECLISWTQHGLLSDPQISANPTLAPLIAILDRSRFCSFSIADVDIQEDYGADGIHPGPRASSRFATLLMEEFLRRRSSL